MAPKVTRRFDSHELVRNRRQLVKIEVSREGDGAFRSRLDRSESHWLGRTCKAYGDDRGTI